MSTTSSRTRERTLMVKILHKVACLEWVTSRRMPDGGYCAFRDEKTRAGFSNIADTAWALEIFRRLKEAPPEVSSTAKWIESCQRGTLALSRSPALAFALSARVHAGLPWRQEERRLYLEEVERLLDDGDREKMEGVDEDLASLLRVPQAPDLPRSLSRRLPVLVGNLEARDLREARPQTLPALEDRLTLLEKSGTLSPKEIHRRGQEEETFRHTVWGWTRSRGSTAVDLFVIRAGVRLANRLQAPFDTALIEDLVLSCRSRLGGFGPLPGAIPGLDATLCAVEILQRIHPSRLGSSSRGKARPDHGFIPEDTALSQIDSGRAREGTPSRFPLLPNQSMESDRP
ncbi:MAG: hypothetical protein ACP5OP_04900 [Leptospirillia bacterium]